MRMICFLSTKKKHLRRQARAKWFCSFAVVFSYVCAGLLPLYCTGEKGFLGFLQQLLADNTPLLKCTENANVADAMVQMISLRTKLAVWLFLLIGTAFIFELEISELRRTGRNVHRGWRRAVKEYMHTESMLQSLQNLSSILLCPFAFSMFLCHAAQSCGFLSRLIVWLDIVWLEYIISIGLTGCSM